MRSLKRSFMADLLSSRLGIGLQSNSAPICVLRVEVWPRRPSGQNENKGLAGYTIMVYMSA
jgi:hypothetical protein